MSSNNVIKVPDLDFTPDPRGLGCVYFESMSKHRNKIAQIDAVTGQKDTYEAFLQRCIQTAIKMRAMEVQPGDVISICTLNHLNSHVPFIAALFVGATVACLDPSLPGSTMKHLIQLVKPKILFASEDAVDVIDGIIDELNLQTQVIVFGNTTQHVSFQSFLVNLTEEDKNNFRPTVINDWERDALIIFSSGTTGVSKGIRYSHRSWQGLIAAMIAVEDFYDSILCFSSLYWGSAAIYCSVSISLGSCRIVASKFDNSTVWNIIDTFKPTFMFISPYHITLMYQMGIPRNIDVDSLKAIIIGGGSLPCTQIIKLREFFGKRRICLSYGLTEAGIATYFKSGDTKDEAFLTKIPGSCGSGMYGMSLKIVDPDNGRVLGPNEKGEVCMKGAYMSSGYFNMDSSGIWDEDGFVKSGDIGYYDEDHYFYIVGRLKEQLKYQSLHVQPINIENVLLTHPRVMTAVVIGNPHAVDGDHPMAVVVLKDEIGEVTEAELIQYVNNRVHDREQLRGGLRIVDSIPLTPSGKINRLAVKKEVLGINSTTS